ncbi:glycine-rich protein 5-like [Nilaparvata lugens]|uniref:glycine-rich protein 5-like n=1 Tax=Nilaparvata lugens TaxID=108931 RepID=UPI00193DC750|nr:glycine-rich protein 5-like [Nilaparvata lugens]
MVAQSIGCWLLVDSLCTHTYLLAPLQADVGTGSGAVVVVTAGVLAGVVAGVAADASSLQHCAQTSTDDGGATGVGGEATGGGGGVTGGSGGVTGGGGGATGGGGGMTGGDGGLTGGSGMMGGILTARCTDLN